MTVVATIAVDVREIDLGAIVAPTTDIDVDLTQFVPLDGGLIPYFWAERGDLETYEAEVRADGRVAELERLDGTIDKALYRIRWSEDVDGFLHALADQDILVEESYTTGNGSEWVFHLRAMDGDAMSAFQRACTDAGIPIDVRKFEHNPTQVHADRYGLTEKQREALELAFNEGYYNVPRDRSLTDLAERLDITRQSFSRRLNRGTYNLLDATVMSDA